MIIHEPEIHVEGEEVSFSARVEFQQAVADVPDQLWFKIPAKYEDWLSGGSEAFAAALLLTAMYWGEDMEIRGAISPKFAYGYEEYKKIFHMWLPNTFRNISLSYGEVIKEEGVQLAGNVLAAYSGGVDSTFVLWSNLGQNQPLESFRITHGYFVQGLDYNLDEVEAYQTAAKKYAKAFDDLGLVLLPVRTNAKEFLRYRVTLSLTYGGILIGCGLALGKGFDTLIIPSGDPYYRIRPVGSNALIDHLLSTDAIEVIHYGATFSRLQKLKQIMKWEMAQENLRVCVREPKQLYGLNCSNCSKCFQNMIRLQMMGTLEKFNTFPHLFNRRSFLPWMRKSTLKGFTLGAIRQQAIENHRWDYYIGLWLVQLASWFRRTLTARIPRLLGREKIYWLKQWYYGRNRQA